MEVTVFGAGYVGLVTACCLAEVGNDVVCVDINPERIEQLRAGICPIYEAGLEPLIKNGLAASRLQFTQDAELGVKHGLVQFIAVSTPPKPDGCADLTAVDAVSQTLGQFMTDYRVVVMKSTAPVGTGSRIEQLIQSQLSSRKMALEFDVVSNPEFLKEGRAVADFKKPDRIIIGTESAKAIETMKMLYAPFNRKQHRVMEMRRTSAELTKYAANAMLATRISFMNELSALAERVDADIESVRLGLGADPRIGPDFIYPGCGFGGSCFPKDLRALRHLAKTHEIETPVTDAVIAINERQKGVLVSRLTAHFKGQLKDKRVALWGLAFKPGTDDIRDAPSLAIIEALLKHDLEIVAYDPIAAQNTSAHFGDVVNLRFANSAMDALEDADALLIATDWDEFRSPSFDKMKAKLRQPVIIDGRNLYDPAWVRKAGFAYYGVGRGAPAMAE